MNSVLVQAGGLLRRTRVLKGGRAPARWKLELARHTDRFARVFRARDWLREVTDARLSLCEEPLFGSCLAELTLSRPLRSNEAATTSAAAGFSKPISQTTFDRRALEGTRDSNSPHSMHPKAQPRQRSRERNKAFDLPAHAASSLLSRLADPLVNISGGVEKSLDTISSLRRGNAASRPPELLPGLEKNNRVQLIAGRTAKRLRSWPAATLTRSMSLALVDVPQGNGRSLLEEQWATPLNGPQASPELLEHHAQQSHSTRHFSHNNRSNQSRLPKARASEAAPRRPSETNRADIDLFDGDSPSVSPLEFHHPGTSRLKQILSNEKVSPPTSFETLSREVRPVIHDEMTGQSVVSRLEHPSTVEQSNAQSALTIAPPALTSTLPPLHPITSPGAAARPLAADAARQAAWRDEVAQERDLSFLAAQIKRILDEEARRHGIDV